MMLEKMKLITLAIFVGQLPSGLSLLTTKLVQSKRTIHHNFPRTSLSLSSRNSNWDENYRKLQDIQEREKHSALIDALVGSDSETSSLVVVHLRGKGSLPVANEKASRKSSTRLVLALTCEREQEKVESNNAALIVPLDNASQLKMVSITKACKPLSKSVLLGLNSLLVNRDDALFDNLPWSTWSVDPQLRNRDAAGNPIDKKFHLGKRDAYNRFMGKDWQGRSLGIGNLALRLKYMLEAEPGKEQLKPEGEDATSCDSLAKRILQLEIRELQMDLAEVESELAISRNNNLNDALREEDRGRLEQNINDAQANLTELMKGSEARPSKISEVLDRIAQWSTANGANAPPYRGAMGYAPMLDSKEDIDKSHLPYTSPYDLLKEILEDQLNARVIGCILENSSLLRGNYVLGGAVILQRITATKSLTLMGETVTASMPEQEFGNENVKGGEVMLVECDADEAIGIAISMKVPIKVDSELFNRVAVPSKPARTRGVMDKSTNSIWDALPVWNPMDMDLSLEVEGEKSTAKKPSPISIPRTTSSFNELGAQDLDRKLPLFPNDNPIQSLNEYDALTNEDKAKALLESSNFQGRLPRPRVVRNSKANPLDELLIPLIDESVRRQYLIRDADQRGDVDRVAELKASTSSRQIAQENAAAARANGNDDDAEQWENEADFLESLRADVTQDEGSYNRFLDRDEWYERDRQATAKRVKKSSFGTLLDGIE